MSIENLLGVAIGGLIGFLAAYGMELLKRHWKVKEDSERIARLREILYEEVEQLAELLDVDLGIVESDDLDFILGYGKGTEQHDGKIQGAIERLQKNRIIFESQADRLLELPGYLPNSLVRFYSRLQVNCAKMLNAISKEDIRQLRELRSLSLTEAEVLKHDLKNEQK